MLFIRKIYFFILLPNVSLRRNPILKLKLTILDSHDCFKSFWTYHIRLDIMLRDLELHKLTKKIRYNIVVIIKKRLPASARL